MGEINRNFKTIFYKHKKTDDKPISGNTELMRVAE